MSWEIAAAAAGSISATADVWSQIRAHRERRAAKAAASLEDALAGLDTADVAARLAADPRLVEIVTAAVEAAVRSVDDEHVDLLMRAVRKGLEAEDDTDVDEAHFHTRTLVALDVPHLTVLRIVVSPRPGRGQMHGHQMTGHVSFNELAALAPGTSVVQNQILARLVGEGLVYVDESELLSVKITGGPHVSATGAGDRFATWLGIA